MKLYHGGLSPFTRKVMVAIHEKKLLDRIEIVAAPVGPTDPNLNLMKVNPLGKIPALLLDDGRAVFDSPVICEYLDDLDNAPTLFPVSKTERLNALCLNALCDGILDAGITARIESIRPTDKWDKWSETQLLKIKHALDALETTFAPSSTAVTIGEIAAGCALGWIDFRMPQLNWREQRPQLAAWFATFSQRPSMLATAPKAA